MDRDLVLFSIKKKSDALSPIPSTIFYAEGCPFRCKGCLYWESHDRIVPKEYPIQECADIAIDANAGCIILSGGDPLLQAGPFAKMMEIIREKIDTGLIIYCGETDAEISDLRADDSDIDRLIGMADMIISGRYESENDCGQRYIGSSNQHVTFLTERYKGLEKEYERVGRKIEMTLKKNGNGAVLNYSGVPNVRQRALFEQLVGLLSGKSDFAEYDFNIRCSDSIISIYSDTELLSEISLREDGLAISVDDIGDDDVLPLASAIIDNLNDAIHEVK